MRKGIDDAIQRQFAEASLQSLMERHAATSITPITYHDWAVSSLEIFNEGEVLGQGSFGTVYTGRWQGCRVAVKHLALSISRQVSCSLSPSWVQTPWLTQTQGTCKRDRDLATIVTPAYCFFLRRMHRFATVSSNCGAISFR